MLQYHDHLMSFYPFYSMNPNELAPITFLAACLGFVNLNPYAFRGCVMFGVVKIVALLINTEDTWEKNIACLNYLSYMIISQSST